jgi:hypothetical protein
MSDTPVIKTTETMTAKEVISEQVALLRNWNIKNIDAETEQVRRNIETMLVAVATFKPRD